MHWRLGIDVVKGNRGLIFPNDFGRYLAGDDFLKNRHEPSVSSAQRTIKPRSIGSQRQFFANEADNFLAQCVAGARPCFGAAEMLYTKLQRRKPKVLSAGFDQRVDSLFQQTEKRKLIPGTGTKSDIQ